MASVRSRIGEFMEDRYLYRGKRIDEHGWVEGQYVVAAVDMSGIKQHIIFVSANNFEYRWYVVDPSTIGQCTGLKDKNGKLIWENDIVRTIYDGIEHIYQVIWDELELDFKATNGKEIYESNFEYLPCCDEVEVIGNKFDNQELLEAQG